LREDHRAARRRARTAVTDRAEGSQLKSWSAHLIGGKKMILLSVIEAVSEAAAIERAAVLLSLDEAKRKRLAVNLRR
jgi:hypothetical protein